MKNTIHKLSALLSASLALVLLFSSCGGPLDGPVDPSEGGNVLLQARISPEDAATRTSYSGETITSEGVVKERINWSNGDVIRIASDQAHMRGNSSQLWADYQVTTYTKDATSLKSQAAIKPYASSGHGLVWREGVTTHRFYGMYPSPALFGGNSNVALDALTATDPRMHAFIPATQYLRARGSTGADAREFLPSSSGSASEPRDTTMRFAWMYSPVTEGTESAGKKIVLDFHPVFTAFEFILDAQQAVTVTSVSLSSETRALNGNFTVKTSATFTGDWYPGTGQSGDWYPSAGASSGGSSTTTYPVSTYIPEVAATAAAQKVVTASLPDAGVKISPGSPISVTLLALPQAHKGLTFSVTTASGTRKLALKLSDKTTWIAWRGCRKYRISGLTIPSSENLEVDSESLIWKGDVLDIQVVDTFGWGSGLDVVFGDNMVFSGNGAL